MSERYAMHGFKVWMSGQGAHIKGKYESKYVNFLSRLSWKVGE